MQTNMNDNFPEAPASATLSVVTPKGYNTLFTLRETTGKALLTKITALENELEELGYKPQVKQIFGKKEIEYVEGRTCLKDGGRLKIIHAKDGKTYWSCENGKYDYMTKTSSGCRGFWTPEKYELEKNQLVTGESIPVEEYDK